ncbi:hypothetical protein KKB43_03465 [Patescibacteria group bacterium]|nr:hypothetical protein [Patescibacteria group bacterium]MBU4580049.1 hypothetical protein [Patescibacteria group bacterium]
MKTDLETIRKIIQDGFLDIVTDILEPSEDKLRIILKDKSFMDIRISQIVRNRFDFHWERRHIDKNIFRYDNFPDIRWKRLKSFPYHLHYKQENKVIETNFRKSLPYAFIDFIEFVREKI